MSKEWQKPTPDTLAYSQKPHNERRNRRTSFGRIGKFACAVALGIGVINYFYKPKLAYIMPVRTFYTGEAITAAPSLPITVDYGYLSFTEKDISTMSRRYPRETVKIAVDYPDGRPYDEVIISAEGISGVIPGEAPGQLTAGLPPGLESMINIERQRSTWNGRRFVTKDIGQAACLVFLTHPA